jgi:hypothetical protein
MTWIIGVYTIRQRNQFLYEISINGKIAMQAQHFAVAFAFVLDERAKPSENFKNLYNIGLMSPPATTPEAPAS